MWELKEARDLKPSRTYVQPGNHHSSARVIGAALNVVDDVVTFTARDRFTRAPVDIPVTLAADAPVYVLNCTCGGMGFICNRWVFTGECKCVHHPLPKGN